MNGYFHRITARTPTRLWINNTTIQEAKLAIEAGAVSCTQNPSYVNRMLEEDAANTLPLARRLIAQYEDDNEVLIRLQAELVGLIAKEFYPLYEKSHGRMGFVTIQGDPFHENREEILRQARIARAFGVNVMVKIPVVPQGLEAIRALAQEGIPLCCTEVFAVRQALDVMDILSSLDNIPPVYIAHIAGIYDEYLRQYVRDYQVDIDEDTLWHAGLSIAKKVYALMQENRCPAEFLGGGARGLQHFTEMVGAVGGVTINWKGYAQTLIEQNPPVVSRFSTPTPASVVDTLAAKLPDYNKGYFADSLAPEEYESFGPVALFRSTFEKAWLAAREAICTLRREQ